MTCTCETCKYSKPHHLDVVSCRRFPPSFRSNGHVIGIAFPTLHKSEWCGEYVLKTPDMPIDEPVVEPLDEFSISLLTAVSQYDLGTGVSTNRIWDILGCTLPKVFDAVRTLEEGGYVIVSFTNYNGEPTTLVSLSAKGTAAIADLTPISEASGNP